MTNRHPSEPDTDEPDAPSMSRTQVLCLGVATFVAGWAGEWLFDWTWRFASGVFLLAWAFVFLVMRRVK